MKSIEFNKTGNFWIDNGLVGLYKIIRELQEGGTENIVVQLQPSKLLIEVDDDEVLIVILNRAKEKVVQTYLKDTGAGWIFKQGAFEVYRKKDFKMHLKPFFVGKTPRTEGALCVPDAKDNELGAKGRRMLASEHEDFLSFKEKSSPVLIGDKKIPLTGKGFLNSPPKHEIGEDVKESFFQSGNKRCHFSGESFKLVDTVTGMDFPFLTGKSGEQNFASFLVGKPNISSKYAYVGLFSFYNLYYQLGDISHYFILYDSNLKSLSGFSRDIQKTLEQIQKADFCNFETYIIGTKYQHEALFNFIVSIYRQVQQLLNRDLRRGIFTKSVFTLSNDGNIFREVEEYSSLESMFSLFDAFANYFEGKNYFESLLSFISRFSKKLVKAGKPEYDTTWRNQLCSEILSFKNINKTIDWFLGEVKTREESGGIPYLDKILEIYISKTQNHMNTEMVRKCRSIGTAIGIYSKKDGDKGALFSLRNAKNRIEFLKVLSQIQFRIANSEKVEAKFKLKMHDDFFEMLPDKPEWEEYKSLVSIFAMNSFLKPENEKEQG